MPVAFSNIPANLRIPLYWVEVDSSMAGLPILNQPALLVGTMSSDGVATPDVPIPIGTQAQADHLFGQGSELAQMFVTFFANNFAQEVWGLPVAEPVGAAAATGTIAVTTPATEAGTIHLYIAGKHVAVNIGGTDTAANIATAMLEAIEADTTLPVSADIATPTDTVNLTAKWKGVNGNEIDVRLNYMEARGGEVSPVGLVLTLPTPAAPGGPSRLSGGVGVPDFDNGIAAIGEQNFEYVALPYTDSTSLMAWATEYGFDEGGRWGWARELFGHVFSAKRGTYADLLAFGALQNSPVISVMGVEDNSPSPIYDWAAAYTSKAGRALLNDPARPLQTLQLQGVRLAPLHFRFNVDELNALAGNGIATQKAGSNFVPMISRETTTYQRNLYQQPDDSYELVTTLSTLATLLRNQRAAITSKFPRHKLANDGTRFGPGQAITTPGLIKAELIGQYRVDEYNGLVEDTAAFKDHLLVERDPNNPNRVNVLYPPDLINQLRIFAVLAQFRLQYDRGIDTQIVGPAVVTARAA